MRSSIRGALLGGALVAASCLVVLGASAATMANGARSALSKEDRALLAEARGKGASTVTVLIASKPGANTAVAQGLRGLGASVEYRDDSLDYIRAAVATDKV